jgi:hypothetical protein
LKRDPASGTAFSSCGLKVVGQIFILLFVLGSVGFGATPANDDFENPTVIQADSLEISASLKDATLQTIDATYIQLSVNPATYTHSVWWLYSPTNTLSLTVEVVTNSHGPTDLGIFTITQVEDLMTPYSTGMFVGMFPKEFLNVPVYAGFHYRILYAARGDGSATFRIRGSLTNYPIIMIQPQSQKVSMGGSCLFTVLAAAPGTMGDQVPAYWQLGYQWRMNGTNLIGENYPMLAITNVGAQNATRYSVLVTNHYYSTLSEEAVVTLLSDAPPSSLTASAAPFAISATVEPSRRYRMESSSDLVNWVPDAEFKDLFWPDTSVVTADRSPILITPRTGFPNLFFRLTTYSRANEICINNLRRIQFAMELRARLFAKTTNALITIYDIPQYFSPGGYGDLGPTVICPEGGTYGSTILGRRPTCTIPGHVLEEPRY